MNHSSVPATSLPNVSRIPSDISRSSSSSVHGTTNARGSFETVAPQNAQLRMNSRPSPPVLSEMRQQFSPYPNSGRRRNNLSRMGSPSPLVNLQMFCLGGPRDLKTPDIERKSLLMALDLAQGVVSIGNVMILYIKLAKGICFNLSKIFEIRIYDDFSSTWRHFC